MYCGKCKAYIPEGPGVTSCFECGASVQDASQDREVSKPQVAQAVSVTTNGGGTKKGPKNYFLKIDGFEGHSIEVVPQTMFSAVKLLVDGQTPPKGQKRNQMLLRRTDDKEVVAAWQPKLFGMDVPDLEVDGQLIRVVEPLKWHEWLWAGLPLVLVFSGGAVGGGLGAVAFYFNIKIFRSSLPGWLKFVGCLAVSAVGFLVLMLAVSLILGGKQAGQPA